MKKTKAHIVFGLGYGDEGKGTMVDFLARHHNATLVVRFNGGSQAAHNVVLEDGKHHTFSQIGSAAFVPGVRTLLSKYMLWDPFLLALEAAELSPKIGVHALDRHHIDERAPVITMFHIATNRLKEWLRGKERHGSCGKGVGETAYDLMYHPGDVIIAGELTDIDTVTRKLIRIQARKRAELAPRAAELEQAPPGLAGMKQLLFDVGEPLRLAGEYRKIVGEFNIVKADYAKRMIRGHVSVWEGAQGVLLDEWHGFHPFTTWSTTTPRNALALLGEAGVEDGIETTGVIRSFMTRHGAGPFVTEDNALLALWPGEHNRINDWQGSFRAGGFDGVMLRYALAMARMDGGIDNIALTHLDAFERGVIPFTDEYLLPDEPDIVIVDTHANRHGRLTARVLVGNDKQDLEHQERLTKLLASATPVRTGTFDDPGRLLGYIEQEGRTPIRYLSFGPRASDKRLLVR